MAIERTDPPYDAAERPMLEAWLEYHRATLALKCADLTAEQLRERAVPPSTITLLGLLRHMAEVERGWFRRTLLGEEIGTIFPYDVDEDADFNDIATQDPAEALALWEEECRVARANAASVDSLDALATGDRRGRQISLRWIMVHMIEEYARHNGHADFLRERIDGQTGD